MAALLCCQAYGVFMALQAMLFKGQAGYWLHAVRILLLAVLVGCTQLPDSLSGVAGSIGKSPNDRRDYRALVLDNGLKVMLVSDPETEKAAAALDVNAGSNADPAEFQGLAHFLEHMLFLGTRKYPQSGEYQEYISSHGGSHNAYTAFENTNYYFDVERDSLAPALDRFSQFFIAPLFTEDYVNRERNAVNSEYQSNLQSDGRRAYSIFKQVMNQAHPMSQFSVGSLETLQDKEAGTLRQALLNHHERYYSANLMSLAILGQESLDELEVLAREYFEAIPNTGAQAPGTNEPLFERGRLPALLEIMPVRDSRSLGFTFPIPVVEKYYRAKPLNYLGNILGHEGEGSLMSVLKARGWANGLSAGAGMSYPHNATFAVNVALTEAGLEHIDEIGALLFQFIELARRDGIQSWIFDEQRTMAQIAFLFQESGQPIGLVGSLSRRLQLYPAAEVITAAYTFEDYNPALYRDILSYLRPDNVLLTLTSQRVSTDSVDPWFGGEYRFSVIPDARVASWLAGDIDPALAINGPNPFLPDDLGIVDAPGVRSDLGPDTKPELIQDNDGIRYWFRHDNRFQVPRADFNVYALTPLFSESLENTLLSSLAISLVSDSLNEYSYPANLAGVFYGVSRRARGFTIRVGGYNDKQPVLLEAVLEAFVAADFQQERFDIIRAEMIRGLENAGIQMPYTRLFQKVQGLMVNPYWSEEQQIAALEAITLDQVRAFVPRMLENLNLQAFYHGNVLEDDAREMMDIVTRYLHVTPEIVDPPFGTVTKMPADLRVEQVVDVDHVDSAIVIYLQGTDDSLQTRATNTLLGTILRTPFFDELRTQQQLGYVVNAGTLPILDVNGLAFTIESPNTDPAALERRIDDFFSVYAGELAAMPESMFDDIRSGLLNNLRQEPQTLQALSNRYWSDILLENYTVDSTHEMADAIAALTKADIVDYYNKRVIQNGGSRLVAIAVGSTHGAEYKSNHAPGSKTISIPDDIDRYNAFKADAEVYQYSH